MISLRMSAWEASVHGSTGSLTEFLWVIPKILLLNEPIRACNPLGTNTSYLPVVNNRQLPCQQLNVYLGD